MASRSKCVGMSAGNPRLVGQHEGQNITIDVNVEGNPFNSVTVGKVDLLSKSEFSVDIQITGSMSSTTEYRAVLDNGTGAGNWKTASGGGNDTKIVIKSPTLTFGSPEKVYTVYLESRDKPGGVLERFPCSFRVVLGTEEASR